MAYEQVKSKLRVISRWPLPSMGRESNNLGKSLNVQKL